MTSAVAWSNGGYSADPDNPDYGTHDWMAEHALEWLPANEKAYIVDNLNDYLFGTELPDLPSGQGGIGDTFYHHVYYETDGTVMYMEDDSAWRASTEYNDTLVLLVTKDLKGAAKNAGVMTHYIVDVSVWAHVMGWPTREWWGVEDQSVHSSYENHVRDQTTSYTSPEWDPFLEFDGKLEHISAYNSTLEVAYNSTFGENGEFNCTWMNASNNDWNDPDFENRTGRLLNLGVNAIADVLHTLALDAGLVQVNRTQVKVNEFEQNPSGLDVGNEWVELYNPTNDTADLSFWYLENGDGDRVEFPFGTKLLSKGYMNVTFPSQWLDNTNESVGIYTPYGDEIDVSPRFWDEENDDRTWSRLPNGIDTNSTSDWSFQNSTRNETNDPPAPPPVNTPPVPWFNITPVEGNTTTRFVVNASASYDVDGDLLYFEWDWGDGTSNTTGMVSDHTYADPGVFNITLAVDDHNGSINTTTTEINVSAPPPPPDDPPVINAVSASPEDPDFQDTITLTSNVTDDKGIASVRFHYIYSTDPVPGTWHEVVADPAPYEVHIGPFAKNTTLDYFVEAIDTGNQTARYPTSGNLSINISRNLPPVAVLDVDRTTVYVNEPITFLGNRSTDGDGTILEYLFDLGDCNLSGWISEDHVVYNYSVPGDYNVTLTVKDNDLDLDISTPVLVHIDPIPRVNHPPTIIIGDIPNNISVNQTLDLLVEIGDQDDDDLVVTLDPGPDGMELTADDHLIWTPRADQVGIHTIKIEVSDGEFLAVYEFQITVEPLPPPPMPPKKEEDEEDLSWLWYSLIAAVVVAACIGTAVYLMTRKREAKDLSLEDIFIIHDSGRLLAHVAKEIKPEAVDQDVMSGMLTALQDLVKESMDIDGSLEIIKHGDNLILMARGTKHFVAVVIKGEAPKGLMSEIEDLSRSIEEGYGHILQGWDGNMKDVKGIKRSVRPFLDKYRR